MTTISPMCVWCIHVLPDATEESNWRMRCEAYPYGIPPEIIDSKVDHRKPYKGDHGIQFEAENPEVGWPNPAEIPGGGPDPEP